MTIANPHRKNAAERRLEAYFRLGVSPEEVRLAPKISHHLSKLQGGVQYAVDLLRGSNAPEARKFILVYEDVLLSKSQRDLLPIEAFALAAGVTSVRLLEIIVGAAAEQGQQLGKLYAAMAHPAIVQTSVAQAVLPEGWTDREWQLKHAGFLPVPKGSQINVNATANAVSQAAALTAGPPPEDTIRRLVDRFNDGASAKALPPHDASLDIPAVMPHSEAEEAYVERESED